MKTVKDFLNRLIYIFSIIPLYLRGLVVFFVIVAISVVFRRVNKIEYYMDDGPNYVVLRKTELEELQEYLDEKDKNNLKQEVKVDKKNNLVKGVVKEELKSNMPTINTMKKGKNDAISSNTHLISFMDDYVIGNSNAPVTIIEYSNFKCPHCISFHKNNMEKIKTNYIDTGKVKYIKRLIIQNDTLLGVMLPYCAKKEFVYSIVNDLFNSADVWTRSSSQSKELKEIALNNGFDPTEYDSCIKNKELAKKLLNKQNIELKELSIYSTPTIFIDGKKQRGSLSYEELSKKIDKVILKLNND